MLGAYRVGARLSWREAAAAAREAGFDAETLSLLAESIFAYIDELSAESAAGFAEAQSAAAGEADRRRRVLVEHLMRSPPADPVAVEASAREAGWALPDALAALVWVPGDERVPPMLPPGTLTATVGELQCAFVPDVDAPGRRAELARALGRRGAALGPAVPWPEAERSARRALATLGLAEHGLAPQGRLLDAGGHLGSLVVHADPVLLRELAARRLAPLEGLHPNARARLTETLAAWLAARGGASETAAALGVHPQTVRYRLGQLRQRFGDALEDAEARFELELALRALRAGRAGHATRPEPPDG